MDREKNCQKLRKIGHIWLEINFFCVWPLWLFYIRISIHKWGLIWSHYILASCLLGEGRTNQTPQICVPWRTVFILWVDSESFLGLNGPKKSRSFRQVLNIMWSSVNIFSLKVYRWQYFGKIHYVFT